MKARLTILIATVGERHEKFKKLVHKLMKQVEPHQGKARILVYWNNYEFPLSEIRQDLVEQADSDYICFVDDDDDVPDYYVDEIMKAIETNPDYVGWRQQLWHDGEKMKPTYHSLRYRDWSEDDKGWYRDISHLNPIKRDIALKVSFVVDKGIAEDQPWAKRIAPWVETEVYIDKVMYFYHHTTTDSVWRGKEQYKEIYYRPEIKHKYLAFYSKYSGLTAPSSKEEHYTEDYYKRDIPENWYKKYDLLRPDELAAICYAFGQGFTAKNKDTPRDPGVIYSIGCGEGILEKKLEDMGCEVIGVDPAPGAKKLYQGKKIIDEYPGGGGTVIFCESVEHLFPKQFDEIWDKIDPGVRVIFVNWMDFHPIEPDTTGYDHVRLINDEFYDRICYATRVIFRRGSHLVLEKITR